MKKDLEFLLHDLPQSVQLHIKHLERVRSDFIANVSHELRTPLTVIHGYLEMLLNEPIADKDPVKKIYHSMFQQSIRMERIIDDLLLLSSLENETQLSKPKTQVNVAHLLEKLCSDIKIMGIYKNQIITTNINPTIHLIGLEEELKSLFSNLITNAVKYTPNHGCIEVSWTERQGNAVFDVVDNGIGIAKEHLPRITERFYRVDKGRSRENGGTGLGLAIVKHVLAYHHAELHVESQLGKGSTFTCIFPAEITKNARLLQSG